VEVGGHGEILGRPELEVGARAGGVLVGIGMPCECGGEGLGCPAIPAAIGIGGAGGGNILTGTAQLGVLAAVDAAGLFFAGREGGYVGQVGGHAPEEQVARDVECAGCEVAAVGFGLHVVGPRKLFGEAGEGGVVDFGVGGQEGLAGGAVEGGGVGVELDFGRGDEA